MGGGRKIILVFIIIMVVFIGGIFLSRIFFLQKPQPPIQPVEKSPVPEKILPQLNVIISPQVEITAFKQTSFNFVIKNEKNSPQIENLKLTLTLGTTTLSVEPNNFTLNPEEGKNIEVKFGKLEPGEYRLNLKIEGRDINISREILVKSKITVGVDEFHCAQGKTSPCWKNLEIPYYSYGREANEWPMTATKFLNYLQQRGIKVKFIESKITNEHLKDVNVLIISSPLQPFLKSEKEAIKKFLDEGNGLLLAGYKSPYYRSSIEEAKKTFNFPINDLVQFLNLSLSFELIPNCSYYLSRGWTENILDHPITSDIDSIYEQCGYLEIETPLNPLVKQNNKVIYAIQYYSNGKIGAIGSGEVFLNQIFNLCNQCNELNFNLIKWLATPPTEEEKESLGYLF